VLTVDKQRASTRRVGWTCNSARRIFFLLLALESPALEKVAAESQIADAAMTRMEEIVFTIYGKSIEMGDEFK
jgi:hypothetical protein